MHSYTVLQMVVEEGSFVRAAHELNITPSAVSHAILKLEHELGFSLLIRKRKGVLLTENGKTIYQLICEISRNEERIRQEAANICSLKSGTVRIGAFNSVTVHWLPEIVQTFQEKYPDISIYVYQGSYNDVIAWIDTQKVDLAFISKTVITEDIDIFPLHQDRLVCVTSMDFNAEHHDHITVQEMIKHPFIMQLEGYDQETFAMLERNNCSAKAQFILENDDSIIAMVERGIGICAMPDLVPKDTHFKVKTYPIIPEQYRTIGLVTINPHQATPATKKMRQHIYHYIERKGLMNV